MSVRCNLKEVKSIIALCACLVVLTILNSNNSDWMLLVDTLVITACVLGICISVINFNASKNVKIIIFVGLAIRMVLLVLGEVSDGAIGAFLNQGDQEKFLKIAISYYQNVFCDEYTSTKYPDIINIMFHIFGPYKIIPRFLNIVFWYAGVKTIYLAADKRIFGTVGTIITSFYCLLPMQVFITVSVLRESIMVFFLMIATLYLCKWIETHNVSFLIISAIFSIPAIILHTGCVAFWGTIFFTYVMWNGNKWKTLNRKMVLLIIVVVLLPFVYEAIVRVFPGKLPSTFSLNSFTGGIYMQGRSDYLTNMGEVTTVGQFMLYTVLRSFYYLFSPTPNYWNSPVDVFAFVLDSVPWMICIIALLRQIRRGRDKRFAPVGIWMIVIFTLIYAWGTRNAGTAMRHRDMLCGPVAMVLMMGCDSARKSNDEKCGIIEH